MSEIKDGGPAFPWCVPDSTRHASLHEGMSLRDYFAAQALLAHGAPVWGGTNKQEVVYAASAAACYAMADAMIKAREAK